jgi:FAD:protein FMN transferase
MRGIMLARVLAAAMTVCALASALPPPRAADLYRVEQALDAMGTAYVVVAYGDGAEKVQAAIEASFEEVRRVDRLLSNYRPGSELSKLNRYAADRPVPVSEELFRLLEQCQEYSRQSGGAFDISVGRLMRVWGFYKGAGRLPEKIEVSEALRKVGYQHIELDPKARTVRFARRGLELDPGGIGKGYAVDRMVEILKRNGIHSAMISAGGSSMYALGVPPGERGWRIKIKDPKQPGTVIQELWLKDESMSTSGTYEKFFEVDGKVYAHIMDPRTGFPAEGALAVSIVAPLTIDSEAWTKPVFIEGRQWAARHLPKDFRAFVCEDKAELACAWLQ